MFSGSVDTGFVLALLFHHGDLEPDCVEVSTRGGRVLSLHLFTLCEEDAGIGLCKFKLPSLLYHPYLVYILFGMPSLHLFTFLMFFIGHKRLLEKNPYI